MDTLSPEERHRNMSNIRAKNTKPEKMIRSALFNAGFRYRICDKRYPGKPDIVLPRYHSVIFINGCFWHAHENCRYFVLPKSNIYFWTSKLQKNKERDEFILSWYKENAWKICIVWECALRGSNTDRKLESVKNSIITWLRNPSDLFIEFKE